MRPSHKSVAPSTTRLASRATIVTVMAGPTPPFTVTSGTADMPGPENLLDLRLLIEHNFYRHALHDFDEIAGRVFRRQQAETRAAAGLNAVDVAVQSARGIRVHFHLCRLPGAHVSELCFLEIRRDPNVRRHNGKKRLPDLHIAPGLDRFVRHLAGFGRGHFECRTSATRSGAIPPAPRRPPPVRR